jgi:hypothetical protein
MSNGKLKFGISVDKIWKGDWSLGMCLSHSQDGQTYIFINFFKWSISIGRIWVYEEEGEFDELL